MTQIKRGDIREDGKVFWRYETRRDALGNRYQQWVSQKRFNELQAKHRTDRSRFDSSNELNRASCKRNYIKNKFTYYARVAKRRFTKLFCTPCWLSDDQKAQINNMYAEAKRLSETGVKYHVDHIVPLSHPKVCGLHVPWNLQIITATENLTKSNRF